MIANVVAAVVIPFLVQLLKMIKLPTKWAPIAAVVLAVIYVAIAKAMGIEGVEYNDAYQLIITALGVSGASVLGYDVVKKLTTPATP